VVPCEDARELFVVLAGKKVTPARTIITAQASATAVYVSIVFVWNAMVGALPTRVDTSTS
jgi:hypothetical protein